MNTLQIVSIFALSMCIAAIWVRPVSVRIGMFGVFGVTAIASGWIEPIALVWMVLFTVLCLSTHWFVNRYYRGIGIVSIVLMSLALGTHALPGFNPILLYENTALTALTGWSALSFWADKPLVGIVILSVFYRERLISTLSDLKRSLIISLPYIVIGISIVYFLGLGIGYVQFDWSPHVLVFLWLMRNLLFTVVAEEALFRGVILNGLTRVFTFKHGVYAAIVISGLLFGIAHIGGGMQYVLLSSIAGILYGYVMMKTGRIEMAILAHLLLNTGHILLLSY